jgi:hypothetical protein
MATLADQIRPGILELQNKANIIANPKGASALNPMASAKWHLAIANIARVIPHNAHGWPVSQ